MLGVVEGRGRKSSGCEKRRRRICVTREEAENGLQRTVRQSSRSETVKNTEWVSKKGKQAI
jgi:hypothetical protein